MMPKPGSAVLLAAPRVWRAAIQEYSLDSEQSAEDRLALSLLGHLHSRHIGITPALAAGVSRMLLLYSGDVRARRTRSQQPVPSPWHEVFQHLRVIARMPAEQSEGIGNLLAANGSLSTGLLPSTTFRYVILRIVAPLVQEACARIGRSVLFSEDEEGCDIVEPAVYEEYGTELASTVGALIESPDVAVELFWRDRAFSLHALTQSRREHSQTLPDTFLPETRLFFDLRPELKVMREPEHRNLQLSRQLTVFDPRWVEAGADGTIYTRRAEDYHRILKSEFIYPSTIRLDRLANTGYQILKPPPKPIQMRDVLIVGMAPGAIMQQASSIFLKACWFDFMMRVSRLLQHNGLVKSELRWIEGDALDRSRSLSLLVQELPEVLTELDAGSTDLRRFYFLQSTGWFPAFLDGNAYFEPVQGQELSDGDGKQRTVATHRSRYAPWIRAVWRAQREASGWSAMRSRPADDEVSRIAATLYERRSLQTSQFAYIHLMLFLPDFVGEDDTSAQAETWIPAPLTLPASASEGDTAALTEQHRYWRAQFSEENSLSITWVPPSAHHSPWKFAGRTIYGPALKAPKEPLPLEEIAGRLIGEWLDDFVEEVERA